jgi:hypothetical protein
MRDKIPLIALFGAVCLVHWRPINEKHWEEIYDR